MAELGDGVRAAMRGGYLSEAQAERFLQLVLDQSELALDELDRVARIIEKELGPEEVRKAIG